MAYTIAFFGSKPYDEASFNDKNKEYGFELRYYKGHLNKHNVILTQGVDAVCIFVNDTADAEVLRMMADNGVKLLALRCAGYNNVDLKAAALFQPPPDVGDKPVLKGAAVEALEDHLAQLEENDLVHDDKSFLSSGFPPYYSRPPAILQGRAYKRARKPRFPSKAKGRAAYRSPSL